MSLLDDVAFVASLYTFFIFKSKLGGKQIERVNDVNPQTRAFPPDIEVL